ncbi:MAG: PEP-CTERM sorting domain-containing protein [Rhodoferax sp.]|nr:PEP-CTERM sorting domain-containing protein [Rhodoferax sp.]
MGTVPEPGTLVLAGAALVALGWTGRRQKWSGTKHVAPHLVL